VRQPGAQALTGIARTARNSVVWGEAGIGKTRLLAEIVAHAAEEDFQILSGATDELASDRPFGALIEVFELYADSVDSQRAEISRLINREVAPSQDFVTDLGFRVIDKSTVVSRSHKL
jgi:predicted ATPase